MTGPIEVTLTYDVPISVARTLDTADVWLDITTALRTAADGLDGADVVALGPDVLDAVATLVARTADAVGPALPWEPRPGDLARSDDGVIVSIVVMGSDYAIVRTTNAEGTPSGPEHPCTIRSLEPIRR